MAEFLFWQNSYAIFFLFVLLSLCRLNFACEDVGILWGKFAAGLELSGGFFRGGDFPRHKFSMGNFRRELFPSGNRENFSTGEIYGMI